MPRASLPDVADVAVLAEQLAGLMRAGLPMGRVWRAVADRGTSPAIRALAAAVLVGQHRGELTGPAIRAHAGSVRAPARLLPPWRAPADPAALDQLIVAVEVSERTGAALSGTLTRLAEALRQEEAAAQERESALAGPRASAAVLSLLPLAGLGLGAVLGSNPAHVLLATLPGRVCLLGGALLWSAGRAWTAVLVRRARRRS
jgi:tight adherence protein B